jgi:hypothetical protein
MIKVYDDLLPPALVDRIEATLLNDQFYWFALDNLSLGGQKVKREFIMPEGYKYVESPGMTKPFWRDGLWYDPYDMFMMSNMIIDYFSEASGIPANRLVRIKGNMLTPNPNPEYDETAMHYPHIDFYNNHHVLVYYVNDSDGDTVIFNEKWSPEHDGSLIPLTIKERIAPKRGRIAYFDGLHYHTSTNPMHHGERVILNINFA